MSARKIVFLKSAPAVPINGSVISMLERLALLNRWFGRDVSVHSLAPTLHQTGLEKILGKLNIGFTSRESSTHFINREVSICVQYTLESDAFSVSERNQAANSFKPLIDLYPNAIFIGNVRDLPVLSFLTALNPSKSIFFLTEDEYVRPEELQNIASGNSLSNELRSIKNLFVASNFIRDSFYRAWGIEAKLLVNAIDIDHYQRKGRANKTAITMLHPYTHKGVDLFLGLVKEMPGRSFVLVGGTGEEYRKRRQEFLGFSNLLHIPYQADIMPIYESSNLVVIPSLWNEVFPRVMVEALATGTPVIASDRGGIRESGGDAAIYIPLSEQAKKGNVLTEDIDRWLRAIESLDDQGAYNKRVELARLHTENYRTSLYNGLEDFNEFIERL